MPEALVSLCEPLLMCPLEMFKSIHLFTHLCFGLLNHNRSEKHHICCICEENPPFTTHPKMPVLFNIVSQIAVEDCCLTARGRL